MKEEIKKLRTLIRYHRDQKMDNRCWLDDVKLWGEEIHALPAYEDMMQRCAAFYKNRKTSVGPICIAYSTAAGSENSDIDLDNMLDNEIEDTYKNLLDAIQKHKNIFSHERTWQDDEELYNILPEKIKADFRLPSEEDFLGEGKVPHAGCPSFWRSHEKCTQEHDIHMWGPCRHIP